jgi:fructose-1,6-bisphosphatase-3
MSPTDAAFTPEQELAVLRPLSRLFPTVEAALAEVARLKAQLVLPKGAIHIISDVHGDDVKLRHVINNASGTLRPLVEAMFGQRMTPAELQAFLTLIFYPSEFLARVAPTLTTHEQRVEFARGPLRNLLELIRSLSRCFPRRRVRDLFPEDYRELLQELLVERPAHVDGPYLDALIDSLVRLEHGAPLLRLMVRIVRDLAIDELVMGGDFWDRGARGDRVMEYLRRQPNVAITWGNHDAAWLAAALGQEAAIAHVLRISLRYRRLSQLEEGYGVTLQPLEHLVRAVYADDPASCFMAKGTGLRDPLQIARMQKATAIMQFKLEGAWIQRNPEFELEHRRLLHTLDLKAGTIVVDGVPRPLKDTHFPTFNPADPYALSPEERACMDRTRQSFTHSNILWDHMRFLVGRGAMHLLRDDHLIFHGCVPVDDQGEYLPLVVDGAPRRGRELFDALARVVVRSIDKPTEKDRDLIYYLWCGPRSPLFGKDRITTLENDLVADPATHVEKKNPYFNLVHEVPFCDKVLTEFGADPKRGLIVNGHVPVKIAQGESPLKRSGKAITIDGAFSSAYGDHGYTLVLEPDKTLLAKHYHFESVEAAVRDGVDIIPAVTVIRQWDPPRRVADTDQGAEIRSDVELLLRLIEAYRGNRLPQRDDARATHH